MPINNFPGHCTVGPHVNLTYTTTQNMQGEAMIAENRQLLTNEPVEFEK